MVDRTEEALATYKQMLAIRGRVEAGELPWSALGDYFTEDAVYIDSAWGRFAGQPAIKRFMEDSMVGLDDWRFPEEWSMADGDRVVSMWWNQLPGGRADGTLYRVAPTCSTGKWLRRHRRHHRLADVPDRSRALGCLARGGWLFT